MPPIIIPEVLARRVEYNEDLCPSSTPKLTAEERKAKKARIEYLVKGYRAGRELVITSAALKGPFDNLPKMAWSKKEKQQQTHLANDVRRLDYYKSADTKEPQMPAQQASQPPSLGANDPAWLQFYRSPSSTAPTQSTGPYIPPLHLQPFSQPAVTVPSTPADRLAEFYRTHGIPQPSTTLPYTDFYRQPPTTQLLIRHQPPHTDLFATNEKYDFVQRYCGQVIDEKKREAILRVARELGAVIESLE